MLKLHENKRVRIILFFLVMVTLLTILWPKASYSFSDQVLVVGIKGDDIYELQGRMSFLGYYKGPIDGEFGWQTYHSVRHFQQQFGMKVDGIAGPKTKLKLWEATKSWRPGGNQGTAPTSIPSVRQFSSNDIRLLAQTVHGEARGEPYEGQVAVAAVVLNRVRSPLFPNTVSEVIFEPRAFTAVDDGQIWLEPNESAYRAVEDAINGWDPSLNALFYFNPVTATSAWIWTRPQIKQIGKHIFCE